MEYKFSQELREKLIDYFLRKHKVDISQETADEYLSSMAGLYSTFKKRNGKENFCSPAGEEKFSLRSST
ncbi:MAG: hypothetical protein WC726_02375 [Parcubacteria group bacterium]|jgi:hypothetical protein